ncbi:hypothetical protein [Dyella telluris]|uniref:Lipoprotein n=1 Tax=Dyella telluris TaxID=2763498 RepID=A0A7G8Q3Z6_9GAMM|nr:hypothetical protein [Dyella telluris]QNK01504.1 hypothetical protein H8F01_21125 [Dyella telluris]
MDKKNKLALLLCAAAGFLVACHEQPATSEQAKTSTPPASAASAAAQKAPVAASSAASSPAPGASFVVGVLGLNDGDAELQGCSTSLRRKDSASQPGDVFREADADKDGVGFMRIDGKLIRVVMVQTNTDDTSSITLYEDAAHTLRIVETVEAGETNENADSTELHGTLTITYKGSTQTLPVDGGVAC